jgi:hypothetical protein
VLFASRSLRPTMQVERRRPRLPLAGQSPSCICHLPFAIFHFVPFPICHLPFFRLPSAICQLPIAEPLVGGAPTPGFTQFHPRSPNITQGFSWVNRAFCLFTRFPSKPGFRLLGWKVFPGWRSVLIAFPCLLKQNPRPEGRSRS